MSLASSICKIIAGEAVTLKGYKHFLDALAPLLKSGSDLSKRLNKRFLNKVYNRLNVTVRKFIAAYPNIAFSDSEIDAIFNIIRKSDSICLRFKHSNNSSNLNSRKFSVRCDLIFGSFGRDFYSAVSDMISKKSDNPDEDVTGKSYREFSNALDLYVASELNDLIFSPDIVPNISNEARDSILRLLEDVLEVDASQIILKESLQTKAKGNPRAPITLLSMLSFEIPTQDDPSAKFLTKGELKHKLRPNTVGLIRELSTFLQKANFGAWKFFEAKKELQFTVVGISNEALDKYSDKFGIDDARYTHPMDRLISKYFNDLSFEWQVKRKTSGDTGTLTVTLDIRNAIKASSPLFKKETEDEEASLRVSPPHSEPEIPVTPGINDGYSGDPYGGGEIGSGNASVAMAVTKVIATVYSEDLDAISKDYKIRKSINEQVLNVYLGKNGVSIAQIITGFDTPAVKSLKLFCMNVHKPSENVDLFSGEVYEKRQEICDGIRDILSDYLDDTADAEVKYVRRQKTYYGKGKSKHNSAQSYRKQAQYIEVKIIQRAEKGLANSKLIEPEMHRSFEVFTSELIKIGKFLKVSPGWMGMNAIFCHSQVLHEKDKSFVIKMELPTDFIDAVADKFGSNAPFETNKMYAAADAAFKDYSVDFTYSPAKDANYQLVNMFIDLTNFYKKFNKSR